MFVYVRERITPPPDCWIIICFSFLGDFLIHQISFNLCCFGNRWTATLNSFIGGKTAQLYLEGEVGSGTREESERKPEQGSSSNGTLISNQLLWYKTLIGLRVTGTALSKEVKGWPCALRFFPIMGCLACPSNPPKPQTHGGDEYEMISLWKNKDDWYLTLKVSTKRVEPFWGVTCCEGNTDTHSLWTQSSPTSRRTPLLCFNRMLWRWSVYLEDEIGHQGSGSLEGLSVRTLLKLYCCVFDNKNPGSVEAVFSSVSLEGFWLNNWKVKNRI